MTDPNQQNDDDWELFDDLSPAKGSAPDDYAAKLQRDLQNLDEPIRDSNTGQAGPLPTPTRSDRDKGSSKSSSRPQTPQPKEPAMSPSRYESPRNYEPPQHNEGSGGLWLLLAGGGIFVALVVLLVVLGFRMVGGGDDVSVAVEESHDGEAATSAETAPPSPDPPRKDDPTVRVSPAPPATLPAASQVEIGVAYGSEKRRWFEEAVKLFAAAPEGRGIRVNLMKMGSLEGAHAVLDGNQKIHVWCPASSMYRDVFAQEWQIRHSGDPIYKEKVLALTPMVFVMWQERYAAFEQKYKEVNFNTIAEALQAAGGWDGIAGKPQWGLFKFAHTHPLRSNSGLQALVLMAYDQQQKSNDLQVADIVQPDFQKWLGGLERGVSGLRESTGDMMEEMVRRGPSSYDAVMVYESVAIEFMKYAEGRWGRLQVVYPAHNMWNDNPYYILRTDWTTDDHHRAAEVFLDFLMSRPIQEKSLVHGFRPGNVEVPVLGEESPFAKYEKFGLRVELPTMCDMPSPQVINNLQQTWQRSAGG